MMTHYCAANNEPRMTFREKNHFSGQWFFHRGEEAFSEVFEFERKH